MTLANVSLTVVALLIVVLTASNAEAQTWTTATQADSVLCGDADGDGVLTARDAEQIRGVLFQGRKAVASDVQMDFDRNGRVDIADSMAIEAHLAAGKSNRPSPVRVKYRPGDVNGDGRVDIGDLSALGRKLFGDGRMKNTEGAADVDGKHGVTIADFEALRRQLMP